MNHNASVVKINHGDVIIINMKNRTKFDQEKLENAFPDNKILFLDKNSKVTVYTSIRSLSLVEPLTDNQLDNIRKLSTATDTPNEKFTQTIFNN